MPLRLDARNSRTALQIGQCAILFDQHELGGNQPPVPRGQPIRRQSRADAWRVSRLPSARRNAGTERELTMMRWGMPPPPKLGGPPVTNIRNTSSPHWRGWLKPENRCLVPTNSFSEYAPEPNPATGKKDVICFALRRQTVLRLRWHLKCVQRRPRHQVRAYPRPSQRLRLPDDCAQRHRRAHPPEGDARCPNDPGRSRDLDDRTSGRSTETSASTPRWLTSDRCPRRQ